MDLPKLNSILGNADLARSMQTMTERELRQLAVNSIEWALGQCQVDPLQFARPLDAILLDNSNVDNVDWESLRALADELDEQVDIHNEPFAHGPPASTESAKFQLKFQLARVLAALCEGGDVRGRLWTAPFGVCTKWRSPLDSQLSMAISRLYGQNNIDASVDCRRKWIFRSPPTVA
ncbi:hypothetical protein IHN63_12730 [Deinococcus sp. 6YEL10]|uniref:hypothetical protein n=1 Tax=Deinococcus sp. 6YEL10 TaxID=2745870 RepID=UPI001E337E4E|nr:hypothetical protein [Deinococcus sp. 6YEL10]MCD0162166.1 hypothetical protein [Deinococcus sp. 6YEL10]